MGQLYTNKEQTKRLLQISGRAARPDVFEGFIPIGFSLDALMDMLPEWIKVAGETYVLCISTCEVRYIDKEVNAICSFTRNRYDAIIDCIEWLVNAGFDLKDFFENSYNL